MAGVTRDRAAGLIDSKSVYGDSSVEDAVESTDVHLRTLQDEALLTICNELRLLNDRFEEAFRTKLPRKDTEK